MDTTATLDHYNVTDIEDMINKAVEKGMAATVNGVPANYRYGKPAKSWKNGSLSITTKARTTSGSKDVWFKTGETVAVTIED